jgi:hypothetical protein
VFCREDAPECRELQGDWASLQDAMLARAVLLARVDVQESPKTAQRFGVTQQPTLVLLKDRKVRREFPAGSSAHRPQRVWAPASANASGCAPTARALAPPVPRERRCTSSRGR